MGTGNVTVRLNLNATGYSAAITQSQRQMQALAAQTKAMGHGTVSSMQVASASIRVLEGGMTGNIRAAERFISMIPGVGKALQAAFPLVGAIALGGVFVKIGSEMAKFIESVNKMPTAINNGFRTLNLSAQSSNDALAVTNDKLANEVAKLEGKPQNNLKLAIDEARVAANKLATALDSDNQKMVELLERNHISALGGLLGKSGTADVAGSVTSYEQKFADIGAQRNLAVHQGDTAAVAQFDQALAAAQASALNWATSQLQQRRNQGPGGLNQDANIGILQGFQSNIYTAQDRQSGEASNAQLEAQKAKLDAARELAEAQKRLLEQQKQAQEQIVAQWRKDLDQARADNDMTLAQEGQFWVRRIEASKKGSISYLAAVDEANKIIAHMRQESMRGQAGFDETSAKSYQPDAMDLSRGDTGAMKEGGRDAAEFLKSLDAQITLQKASDNAYAEAAIRMAEATGQMSKLDAATAQAALHTQEYGEYLDSVKTALSAIANDPALSALQKAQATAGINQGAAQAASQRNIQVLQDQQGIAGQQIGPAIHQALDQMVQSFTDLASSLKDVIPRTIGGLNDNIVKAMTGQKTNFGATFMQAGQGLLKTGLQGAEGMALSKLGFGALVKKDGSSEAAALWVRMAGGAGAGSSVIPGVTAAAGGGGDSGGGLMGFLGKFIQPFVQGHFAAGGDVLAGYPAMVGERGPEMFIPRTAGTIVPNHAFGGGGGITHHYSIDARGATDPAAIHAAVARALPHAVAASMQAQHQSNLRKPQGR